MGQEATSQLLFFAILALGCYLLAVRPQRRRVQAMRAVRSSLAPGSQVITTAGLHATVVAVEGDTVRLEIAPGVVATFASGAVVATLPTSGEVDAPDS